MNKIIKIATLLAGAALFTIMLSKARSDISAVAQTEGFSAGQVKNIEKIVHDYLLEHPEVMAEVQEAYEKKVEAKRGEATASRMPEFYKALDGMKADIANFTVGDGDVTVVEFFDYNCGYCKRTLAEIVKLPEADKRVKLLFLEYPILSSGSREASRVAVAAAKQGKYFEFHKEMFAAGRASQDTALAVAAKIGLDMTKAKADMAAPETDAFIAKVADLGQKLFIDGTPSFVIGDKINPGAADAATLQQLIADSRKDGCKTCVTDASGAVAKEAKKS